MTTLERLELLKDMVQQAIDRGATSVENIHQYIADLPFEALEKAGLLDDDRLGVRNTQRRTIGTVYDAIRRINREIGDLISDQFENLEDGQVTADALESKPKSRSALARAARLVSRAP
jgi:hypothetical protein